ncbi:uncharacterized protein EI97DRAFT_350775, partial [Westerdykella ornata]
LPWYLPMIGPTLTLACQDLLIGYAKIPDEELEVHILNTRDQAFSVYPLATIGEFWFLVLGLSEHPSYTCLLNRLKNASDKTKPLLIDLGTCLGQDMRKLIYDGAESCQLLGVDKCPQFEMVGYELFRDADKMKGRFICADILATDLDNPLEKTRGTWEIVVSSMLLHSFDWNIQTAIVKKMMGLTSGKGAWTIGLLAGDLEEHEVPIPPPLVPEGVKMTRFIHSKESLERIFKTVSAELQVEVKIQVSYQED